MTDQTQAPPAPVDITSALSKAAKIVTYDSELRDRVSVALIASGVRGDVDQLLAWFLATPNLGATMATILADEAVQEILAAHPDLDTDDMRVVDLARVTAEGFPGARTYVADTDKIPDALIHAGIKAALAASAELGLNLYQPEPPAAPAPVAPDSLGGGA